MKKFLTTLLLAATPAFAGVTYQPEQPVFDPDPIIDVSIYGSYWHGGKVNSDDFGAGISLLGPRRWVEFSYDWREGSVSDVHSLSLAGRLYLLELDALSVYGLAGGGYEFGNTSDSWALDGGLGVEFGITDRLSAFADYRYRYLLRDGVGDVGGARLGLSWSF